MHYPRISIVTPSFNQGKYIEQTIQSVINQNYPNLEYIIIDGGSTDNTVEVIQKYEKDISYWISEVDKGQTDAINKGFAKCTGDIFNWINSDDYYEPGTFHKLAKLFTADTSVNVVCGKEWGFNDADQSDRVLHAGSVINSNVFETIRTGIIDQPCTFFIKKSIDNFFPLDTSLRYVMDRQLWWCYLLKCGQQNILSVADVFTHFRLHPQSKSVAESELFEQEFDRLKYSLFLQLDAPKILKAQVQKNTVPVTVKWPVAIKPVKLILAAFASFYAGRSYVTEQINNAAALISLVKKYKGFRMSKTELKIWIAACLLPGWLLWKLKK